MTELHKSSGKSQDEIADAYSSPPWWYNLRGFFILFFSYNSTIGSQLRFFGPHFGAQHLEVACGTGLALDYFLRWRDKKSLPKPYITGIDYAESMLDGAKQQFAGNTSIEFKHADAAKLPFPDNTFDTANIANAVHCFPDVDGALLDVYRILKSGGTLAANVLLYPRGPWPFNRIAGRINRWGIRKGILYTPYEQENIRQKFINAGFEIVSESVYGNCYNVMCRKQ